MLRAVLAAATIAVATLILPCERLHSTEQVHGENTNSYVAQAHTHSSTEFRIDKGLTSSLFESTLKEARGSANSKLITSSFAAQFSLVMPSALRLTNRYFSVPYEEKTSSIPLLVLNIASKQALFTQGPLASYGEASLGYAYTEGIYEFTSRSGLNLKDSVHLHWLPILLGLRTEYKRSFLKPSLKLSLGGQYFVQGNQLDGMQQTFWLPLTQIAASFVLFDSDGAKQTEFFQGLRLGASAFRSFLSQQTVRGWSVDLGTQFLL